MRKITPRTRKRFDAQSTFQMQRHEKAALVAQIDGRRFKVLGDVLRECMYEFFERHDIDPEAFRLKDKELS
jgi:hypothetical protein